MRCAPPQLTGCRPAKASKPSTLATLVRSYRMRNYPSALAEKEFYRSCRSLSDALHHAGLAIDGRSKRYRHQCRIPGALLRRSEAMLQASAMRIQSFHTFDQLHQFLADMLLPICGLGELYVYDTALRVGAFLNLQPEMVYLHAGTRAGAHALGLNARAEYLRLTDFPKPIQLLAPDEIEDFLCIYKSSLTP
jgi:hypothetical protein